VTGETLGAIARRTILQVKSREPARAPLPIDDADCADVLLVVATMFAIGIGAYRVAPLDVFRILASTLGFDAGGYEPQQAAVLRTIRLPRVLLGLITGAGLGIAGALMQGLFRNPLADPTLIGVASGGALAAAFVIVLGATWLPGAVSILGPWTLPLAAFAGALAVTLLVYRIGGRRHTRCRSSCWRDRAQRWRWRAWLAVVCRQRRAAAISLSEFGSCRRHGALCPRAVGACAIAWACCSAPLNRWRSAKRKRGSWVDVARVKHGDRADGACGPGGSWDPPA
jgi:iron complex transport system permease protein